MRLGSTAAAPFLGTQFASLYLGAVRMPTVPGKPVITAAASLSFGAGDIIFTAPSDGGSTILGYSVYVNESSEPANVEIEPVGNSLSQLNFDVGDTVRIAAVNAVGEGPKSNPVTSA